MRSGIHLTRKPFRPFALGYSAAGGQSFPNAARTIINFETPDFGDAAGNVTVGAAWKFTAPHAGRFEVNAFINLPSTAWLATQTIDIAVFVGGAMYTFVNKEVEANATMGITMQCQAMANMAAGQFLDVRLNQNSGGALALVGAGIFNRINIKLVAGPP